MKLFGNCRSMSLVNKYAHKGPSNLGQLGTTLIVGEPNPSNFASCSVMKLRLKQLFPKEHRYSFHGLSMVRKQTLCAVLSSLEFTDCSSPILQKNLLACSSNFLMRLRFGCSAKKVSSILIKISPKCLEQPQYDQLARLVDELGNYWFEDPTSEHINTDVLSNFLKQIKVNP